MNVLPLPRKVAPGEGKVSFAEGWKLDAPPDLAALECLADLKFLEPEARKILRLRLVSPSPFQGEGGGEGKRAGTPDLPLALADESYRLGLSPDLIDLSAATSAGILRGLQTLKQLAREGAADACVIEDTPALPLRLMHIDFRPKSYCLDYLLATIDRLAEMKFNALLVEWSKELVPARKP